tara:strand:- start:22423 stop:23316 length:894 start_codon:yes stop_codon:yes gene_type:complete
VSEETPQSVNDFLGLLSQNSYIADRNLATTLFVSFQLGRPLFIEGEAGVGKTELAKVLSLSLGRNLVRLQCYEGLDISSAVYEWNYARQMIEIRLSEAAGEIDQQKLEVELFSKKFLIPRPLLQSIETDSKGPPVLLIDEIDRADEPFEAFLLELLSDFQITIPEIGTLKATKPPIVVITSNRTREIHDALKRRCLYHWLDYPKADRELAILKTRVPGLDANLAKNIVNFVQNIRKLNLFKLPGVAETIDWARSLEVLNAKSLDASLVDTTLGVLLKYQDDIESFRKEDIEKLLEKI